MSVVEGIINHPSHYGGDTKYEVIKIIEKYFLGFCLGNAIKYILRAGRKESFSIDIRKAIWYLERDRDRLKWYNHVLRIFMPVIAYFLMDPVKLCKFHFVNNIHVTDGNYCLMELAVIAILEYRDPKAAIVALKGVLIDE